MLSCPFPEGKGIGVTPFLPDGRVGFPSQCFFEVGFSFSPLGETGEGLSSVLYFE